MSTAESLEFEVGPQGERPSVAGDLTVVGEENDSTGPMLEIGTNIDRYTVLEVIGTGGIGVVYAAYDPDLDRKVALKLLRPGSRITPRFERRRARLVREAQALARLSHPHVVPVYDVGVYDDRVFVAMEFVEGATLRRWLRERPRVASEILDKYLQAGRGLAAAHAADIVHRDFKPDNVLVGDDGRVRVLDFGLATPTPLDASSSGRLPTTDPMTRSSSGTQRLGMLDDPITSHGQVMGTPAYMAPEQARGEPPDARADQYSYCVSLWEAISGERPKPREGSSEPISLRRRESMVDVPSHVLRTLERGLDPNPQARFPDMHSLLAALERRRWSARRWALVGVGSGLALSLAIGVAREADAPISPCTGAEARLAGVWDESIRTDLRERLQLPGQAKGQDWLAVERQLDRWAKAWVDARTEACQATHERAEQSATLLDMRMACLDRQAVTIAALTESLAAPFDRGHTLEGRLELALTAAFELPDPRDCEAAALLDQKLIREGELGDEWDLPEQRSNLARARGLAHTHASDEALALARVVEREASRDEQPVLAAEATLLIGTLHHQSGELDEAESFLRRAVFSAQAVGHDALTVEGCAALIELQIERGRLALAVDWVDLGEATLQRLGGDTRLEAMLRRAKAKLAREHSDYASALVEQEQVVVLSERLHGRDHVEVAEALTELAGAQVRVNQFDEAQVSIDRALAILTRELGDQHPRYADALNRYGSLQHIRGDDRAALISHDQALTILLAAHGPEHPSVAWTYNDMAIAHDSLAEYTLALDALERARTILLAAHGPAHAKLGSILLNIGTLEHRLGRDDEALATLREAADIVEQELGEHHATHGFIHNTLGGVLFDRGDLEAALREYRSAQRIWAASMGTDNQIVALALGNVGKTLHAAAKGEPQLREALAIQREALANREAALGPEHAELAEHLLWIGEGLLALDDPHEARGPLERGLALTRADAGADPERSARLRHALARALWSSEAEHPRARELSRGALEDLDLATGAQVGDLRTSIATWLSDHGG
jgi:tetratricopeptide (TPR) repeat protein/predicted Ser/Thr protein kinase